MTSTLHARQFSQHTHIEAIRAGQQGYLEIGAIAGDPDDIRHKRYIQRWFFLTADNTADLLPLISQLAAKYGNVYCSRVLYEQPRRDKTLALPTRLLFLDDAPPGSYTYTIETSPKSMHAYILLDEPISPDQAEQLGRRLAYQQGADQGGWDITQLVRVPGTLNTKARAGGQYDEHDNKRRWIPGTGHQITLTKRTGRPYSVAEITEATQTTPALPIDALDPSSVAVWRGNLADLLSPDGLPKRWKNPDITGWKVLRGDIHTKSSSEARYHIIASLVLHGYPDDEIAALGIHLTNFGKMETKGSDWLYRDIARCTRKARQEFADQGKVIPINPSRPGRTRTPADLPRQSPARRGRKCKGSPATYLARLIDEASGDQVHWTLSQAAIEMDVGVATIKRWEVILKAQAQIERVTVSTRQHSYVAILGQLKIPKSPPNQAPSEVSSQISVQRIQTPPNDDRTPNAWENHRGASQPPAAPSLAPSLAPVATPPLSDDQADDLAGAAGSDTRPSVDDQAETASANHVPLADDLAASYEPFDDQADATGRTTEPMADDLAEAGGASHVPVADDLADETAVIALALADDQADEAPAIVLALADDQADNLPPQDELVCGVELTGPAGAFVVVGGAAYLPSGTESWYAAICAAVAPAPHDQADDLTEAMQLVASLDAGDLAERDTPTGQSGADDLAESVQPASVPVAATKTSRTAPQWVRQLHAYMQRLALMSGSELAGQLQKWHNTEKKRGKAPWSTDRIEAVEREIERRDLLGGSMSDQADTPDIDDQAEVPPDEGLQAPEGERTGAGLPPPPCSIGFGVDSGSRVVSQRRSWCSPVARCDWDTPAALVPPALSAPCVPALDAEGWTYERAGSAWRAVHVAGYETAAYINPEAAGRAIERRDYHPVVS